MTKEEREVEENVRPFARFHTSDDHDSFIKGLAQEKQLRSRIEYLQKLRHFGIRSYEEAQDYEAELKKRDPEYSPTPAAALLDQKKRKIAEVG